jgi:2-methylcitrate dehydratase PrpD
VRAAHGAADAFHHENPDTGLEAKFSMEYAAASAALRDRVGLAAFHEDNLDKPAIQHVRERVTFEVDESLHYDAQEAVVELHAGGDTYICRQADPPGTPDTPLSDEELREKFEECASHVLASDVVSHVYEQFRSLDDHEIAGSLSFQETPNYKHSLSKVSTLSNGAA